ncbi:hypothetical protein [Thalassomonas sp. RHCl1]|uniref:pyroglutamyl-peptidase I family protein n=1 Tax=Thalassomonas sp. RHCl1 TaxID=2995320 RepID=UPI00248C39BA|nr:hypothetical protein [Thalassomonas sp. RHCl1]
MDNKKYWLTAVLLLCPLLLCFILPGSNAVAFARENTMVPAKAANQLSIEELRLPKAMAAMPGLTRILEPRIALFSEQLSRVRNLTAFTQLVLRHGSGLWRDAVAGFDQQQDNDDRALYWARLKMTRAIRQAPVFTSLLPAQQQKLLWQFELLSRGQQDIKFNRKAKKRVLITGFDPFFLDRKITQANPSGAIALALDGLSLSFDGSSAEIESLILPVRFHDFDQGMVETLLTPYFKENKIDMLITISMGREHFDLERFPGLRRSASAPDNLNVYTGASEQAPLLPKLGKKQLSGPEFLEFSLPAEAMQAVAGSYPVNDNRKVQTLDGKVTAASLTALQGQVSVEGSGGGYLSNEISYRSLLLREQYAPLIPVGHIHTPKISGYQAAESKKITTQVKAMISAALTGI